MSAREVVPDLLPRLRKAGREVEDRRTMLTDALVLRDSLVVAAVDEGLSQKAVAEAAGLTRTRVNAILGNSGREFDYV